MLNAMKLIGKRKAVSGLLMMLTQHSSMVCLN